MRMVFRELAVMAGMLAVLADAAASQTKARYASAKDAFEVGFQGPVSVAPTQFDRTIAPLVARGETYMHNAGDRIFVVGVQHNRKAMDFDTAVRMSFESLQCESFETGPVIEGSGLGGREIRGAGCLEGREFRAIIRYFVRELTLYQVLTIFRADGSEEPATAFLDSFKLLPRANG